MSAGGELRGSPPLWVGRTHRLGGGEARRWGAFEDQQAIGMCWGGRQESSESQTGKLVFDEGK